MPTVLSTRLTLSLLPSLNHPWYDIAQGIFKGAIVHGLLVGSLFGTIFGVTFPGCVYLQQSFKVRSLRCLKCTFPALAHSLLLLVFLTSHHSFPDPFTWADLSRPWYVHLMNE